MQLPAEKRRATRLSAERVADWPAAHLSVMDAAAGCCPAPKDSAGCHFWANAISDRLANAAQLRLITLIETVNGGLDVAAGPLPYAHPR